MFMGTTWGPPGSCRPQMGPMLAPCYQGRQSTHLPKEGGERIVEKQMKPFSARLQKKAREMSPYTQDDLSDCTLVDHAKTAEHSIVPLINTVTKQLRLLQDRLNAPVPEPRSKGLFIRSNSIWRSYAQADNYYRRFTFMCHNMHTSSPFHSH